MEVEFDVKITGNVLFDFMLRHTYHSMSGIVGTLVGVFLIYCYVSTHVFYYMIGAVVILFYLPCTLFVKAHTQAKSSAAFKELLHYKFTEEGITVSQGEATQTVGWDQFYKATSTGMSLILYTNRTIAWLFPKKDMGEKAAKAIEMISTHMPPSKVKIRGYFS